MTPHRAHHYSKKKPRIVGCFLQEDSPVLGKWKGKHASVCIGCFEHPAKPSDTVHIVGSCTWRVTIITFCWCRIVCYINEEGRRPRSVDELQEELSSLYLQRGHFLFTNFADGLRVLPSWPAGTIYDHQQVPSSPTAVANSLHPTSSVLELSAQALTFNILCWRSRHSIQESAVQIALHY